MKAIPYNKDHYEEVASWFEKRGLPAIPESSLPRNGFIVPGVGAIFLYSMDCDVCQIETAITNPEVPAVFRDQCIDVVTKAAMDKARELKFRIALSYSFLPKIIDQAVNRHGYKADREQFRLLVRDLWEA